MDNRSGERLAVELPAIARTGEGKTLRVTIRNLSCGGAFIAVPPGSASLRGLVELQVRLPYTDPRPCRWRAHVVHQQAAGVGVMFDDLQLGDVLPFLGAEKSLRRLAAWRRDDVAAAATRI